MKAKRLLSSVSWNQIISLSKSFIFPCFPARHGRPPYVPIHSTPSFMLSLSINVTSFCRSVSCVIFRSTIPIKVWKSGRNLLFSNHKRQFSSICYLQSENISINYNCPDTYRRQKMQFPCVRNHANTCTNKEQNK